MAREITQEIKDELRELIISYFEEECEVDRSEFNDSTHIIDELDGDSVMFIELIEIMKKKYDIDVKLQEIGKYLIKNPPETIGKAVELTQLLYVHGNKIVDLVED